MSAVADVLNGAADLIERDGWTQNQYRSVDGGRCLSRAIGDCVPGHFDAAWWHSPLYEEAADYLRITIGRHFLAGWNDQPGRTQAEVVAALRAAAERAA